ncbi:MAG: chemotaxis response regulator protein-glutamate methylesterase, partial [Blastochloris sp.]|nr:chemotaxis response regulator protein-glutamate methylesterase [Blastochloris sp.]
LAPPWAAAGRIKLRPFPPTPPRVIVIGSSTGGPQALQVVLKGLTPIAARFPIIITQHMPPTFTTILAEHLGRASGRPAHEGIDGEPITAGNIYVAPGGRHMVIKRVNNVPVIGLEDGPPVNYCKPAVDPLFASAADAYGAGLLAVVLTGMGSDGAHGAGDVVARGGAVIAQDETTSVVWGMPGATAHSGVCSAVLPLADIALRIIRLASGDRL